MQDKKYKPIKQGARLKRSASLLLAICMMLYTIQMGAFAQASTEEHIAPTFLVTVMNEAELVAEISASTPVITLGTDIYVSDANLIIPAGADITLEGDFILSRANHIEAGSFITVETGASLTIDGVRIEAPTGVTGLRGIYLSTNAELRLLDGSISGFNVPGDTGGGVFVMDGSFQMYGGEINGNTASTGGGVAVEAGSFEMHGGEIRNNTADHGGGVSVHNWSSGVTSGVEFSMQGGEISNNIAHSFGGGAYLVYATFDMWDGKISNNTVTEWYGGGILLDADGILNMHGGEFSGNFAPWGGGVSTHGGQFTMHDGTVSDNTAVLGGGIYDEYFSSFPYISAIYGGAVSGNTAEFGGGIHVEHDVSFTVRDAEISGNTADHGGGVYVTDSATLDVTGASFIRNNSAQSGGGIYTMDVADYNNLTTADYQNITTGHTVVFSGNNASAVYEPPANADADYPNIQYASSSLRAADRYLNPINNFDINYIGVTPAFLVRYLPNGGTGAHVDISAENAVYTILSNTAAGISRTGHHFTGWNTEMDGSGTFYVAGDTITVTSDLALYAEWAPATHRVTFLWNYNREDGVFREEQVSYNASVSKPTDPVRAGYRFEGWHLNPEGSLPYDFATPVMGDLRLYAWWTPTSPPPYELHPAYMFGYGDGSFRPEANLTRAEAATILARTHILGFAHNMNTLPTGMRTFHAFTDVTPNNWFYYYLAWCYDAGLIMGEPVSSNGMRRFRPNDSITREEFAAMFARLGDVSPANEIPFVDTDDISNWAKQYMYTVYRAGWMMGDEDSKLRPGDTITRAETATVINRVLGRIDSKAALTAADVPNLSQARHFPDVTESAWFFPSVVGATNDHRLTRTHTGSIDWMYVLSPE